MITSSSNLLLAFLLLPRVCYMINAQGNSYEYDSIDILLHRSCLYSAYNIVRARHSLEHAEVTRQQSKGVVARPSYCSTYECTGTVLFRGSIDTVELYCIYIFMGLIVRGHVLFPCPRTQQLLI